MMIQYEHDGKTEKYEGRDQMGCPRFELWRAFSAVKYEDRREKASCNGVQGMKGSEGRFYSRTLCLSVSRCLVIPSNSYASSTTLRLRREEKNLFEQMLESAI